jgi:hypothetical protein
MAFLLVSGGDDYKEQSFSREGVREEHLKAIDVPDVESHPAEQALPTVAPSEFAMFPKVIEDFPKSRIIRLPKGTMIYFMTMSPREWQVMGHESYVCD